MSIAGNCDNLYMYNVIPRVSNKKYQNGILKYIKKPTGRQEKKKNKRQRDQTKTKNKIIDLSQKC